MWYVFGMKFTTLRMFISMAQTGSYSETGRIFGVTHSAVSKAMASLGGEFGADLFWRDAKVMRLTVAGEKAKRRFSKMLMECDQLVAECSKIMRRSPKAKRKKSVKLYRMPRFDY